MCALPGERVSVVGTSGSGKTTTSSLLACRMAVAHVELDALSWGPGWTQVPPTAFRERVREALGGSSWVCDGNYSGVRDIVWSRADTVVWLDYPLITVMWQLLRRTIGRAVRREELWQGNRESLRTSFLSRDSILLWALRTYRRRRREYPQVLGRPEHAHLRAIRLRSPSATREWLAQCYPSADNDRGGSRV